jgi:hypothetical protein
MFKVRFKTFCALAMSFIVAVLVGCSTKKDQLVAVQMCDFGKTHNEKNLDAASRHEQKEIKLATYRKDVAKRNAENLKKIGLALDLLNSTIYIDALGTWTEYMPTSQWLGLMMESNEIASLEALSFQGYPGVFIKQKGRPGTGLIFRIEGNEAYPYALQGNGRAHVIENSEQFSISLLIGRFTNTSSQEAPDQEAIAAEKQEVDCAAKILGLTVSELTYEKKKELKVRDGVRVTSVTGPALSAGVQEGDVILTKLTQLNLAKPVSLLIRRGEWAQYTVIRPTR